MTCAMAAPMTAVVTDRVQYEALSPSYCADVANAAAQGRAKKMSHYDVIDVLTTGIDQRADISEPTRKVAKRMATVLVSRIYLDKVSDSAGLEKLSKIECIWANQLLQGVAALERAQ